MCTVVLMANRGQLSTVTVVIDGAINKTVLQSEHIQRRSRVLSYSTNALLIQYDKHLICFTCIFLKKIILLKFFFACRNARWKVEM